MSNCTFVERASDNNDRADAQKNTLKPHLKQQWVIAPDASAAFVANMEDVLEVYQRPRDPERPVVCLDETSKLDHRHARADPRQTRTKPARHDYEYERNGVANLFMVFAPLEGWRHVKVTIATPPSTMPTRSGICPIRIFQMRRKSCWCRIISTSTSQPRFMRPFRARGSGRLVERFEWHYTPKHGSWLDMAESELGVLASQCLDRRIADKQILAHEATAWQDHRNKHHAKADWQFTSPPTLPRQAEETVPSVRVTRATSSHLLTPSKRCGVL